MLYWTVFFLIIALVAAVLGFGSVASTASGVAKLLFVLFLVMFAMSLAVGQGWI